MKKDRRLLLLLLAAPLLLLLQGCLKDTYRETYKIYTPIFQSLTQVRSAMKSGPAQPLKNIGKLNVYGNYIFLNEINKGIHVIDNSDPSSPKNLAFISIPNNLDLAVKGGYLYADSYSDVVVIDISNPATARAVKFMDNAIVERNRYWYGNVTNPDSIRVVVGYNERDTTVSYAQYRGWQQCANCMTASVDLKSFFYTAMPTTGVGGSMARFTIVNDYLYAVSTSTLYSINISDPVNPQRTNTRSMGWNIETIYPFKDKLFIGSNTGLFVYGLSNPAAPNQLSQFSHARSCDPVIADDYFAYVTLRSGTTCNGTLNQMDVLDVTNISAPVLKTSVPLSNPRGLAKDGDKLFVCDGKEGLKQFDASNPALPKLAKTITGPETYDVIALNGNLIVVAKDGLYQYDYRGTDLNQRSKLTIQTPN